jgi:hypothetical protein
MGDGGTVELTEGGGKNGAAMIVWSAGGNTRPGKERRAGGDGVLSMRSRGRTRGERKGGAAAMECPLWVTRRGVGTARWRCHAMSRVGRGAGVAVGWHGWHARGQRQNRGEATLTSGPRHSNGRWQFEYNSNSNQFKVLQNLPNFDRSKSSLH